MSETMMNCINLSADDTVKLVQAFEKEEEDVSEYENHTSDEIENGKFDNNFDTNSQKMYDRYG